MKCFINIVKVKYKFQDGNEVEGLELNLAPKVKKFIHCSIDNLELMKIMGNGLEQWYRNSEFGDNIIVEANWSKDRTYSPQVEEELAE